MVLSALFLLAKSDSEVVSGIRVVGLDFQRLMVVGDRVVHFSLCEKSVGKVVVSFRVVGVDFQRLMVLFDLSPTFPFCTRALPRLM